MSDVGEDVPAAIQEDRNPLLVDVVSINRNGNFNSQGDTVM